MFSEIDELKKLCEHEIRSIRREINSAKGNLFLRWNAKDSIQKAEEKVEKIQQLLVKLESLSEQVTPVVNDLKEIIGVKLNKK